MSTPDLFADPQPQPETVTFKPTRAAGLARLEKFVSRAGAHYASQRNYDYGPMQRSSVSALSPWIRHRLITEHEVLTQTLARHSPSAAAKFVQEVFWRGYFKGWLEQHPSVWLSYQRGVAHAHASMTDSPTLRGDYTAAIQGQTGIACFDHWAGELINTGYLHNHTRMWFASIWIFTLRLPWELGAAFFLRHLMDGDPASNTLSWRWVGGLHTKGKTYLARPDNIAKYTNGQFHPTGQLSKVAEPLIEDIDHPLVPLRTKPLAPTGASVLLITPEDCSPNTLITGDTVAALGVCVPATAHRFAKAAVEDAVARSGFEPAVVSTGQDTVNAIIEAAQKAGTHQVITPFAPLGPVATLLDEVETNLNQAGIQLHRQQRTYDKVTWPHATHGFFKLKKKIPLILDNLKLGSVA